MSDLWKDLLEKARGAQKYFSSLPEQSEEKSDTLHSVYELSKHFQDVTNLLESYRRELDSLYAETEEELDQSEFPRNVKTIIADSRRALRFVQSLLSIDCTRANIQLTAVKEYRLHMALAILIADRRIDEKCQLWASQILTNLGTANPITAEIILNDVKPSPSETDSAKIMLEKLQVSENSNSNKKESLVTWMQMVHSTGGAGNRSVLAVVVTALFNSISAISNGDEILIASMEKIKCISRDELLVNNLVRFMLPSNVIQEGKENDEDKQETDHSDDATEWISRLIEILCSYGMFPHLYNVLGTKAENGSVSITPEQLVLLHCVGSALDEYHMSDSIDSTPHVLGSGTSDISTSCVLLAKMYCQFQDVLFMSKTMTTDEQRYNGEYVVMKEASMIILDILSNSLSSGTRYDEKECLRIRQEVGQLTDILSNIVKELGRLVDLFGIENRGINARELKIDEGNQHLVTSIVRLIGNLCYRCKENQDHIRHIAVPVPKHSEGNVQEYTQFSKAAVSVERNGLHVLLSCTSFAYGCFTLREWAIVAIRNALEGNLGNQKIVEELEAQQTLDTPELQRLKVKVDLDKRGNVRVNHEGA